MLKVLLLCNNAFVKGNGLSAAVRNVRQRLRESGVDARIMSSPNPDPEGEQPDFPLDHLYIPLFERVIRTNGFRYSKFQVRRMKKAIAWADVIHLEECMELEIIAVRLARKMGKPCVASFHLFPQNIAANLGLPQHNPLNPILMHRWVRRVVNHCSDVHCPTQMVKTYLERYGATARLHVISNGTEIPERPEPLPPLPDNGRYSVLCVGRYANDKAQTVLFEALCYSRYADKIDLHFAGKGPKEQKLRRLAAKLRAQGILSREATFGFYNAQELKRLAQEAYLYVHCAWIEVEGLSCLDALRDGAVPVIGENEWVGTTQFALCPESLYPQGDAKALAARIDWWIEHPEEHARMRERYSESAALYEIGAMTARLIEMYHEALG